MNQKFLISLFALVLSLGIAPVVLAEGTDKVDSVVKSIHSNSKDSNPEKQKKEKTKKKNKETKKAQTPQG